MKNYLVRILPLIICLAATLHAQVAGTVSDSARTTMPSLELPEITIVGKKAITLPFARKGEIFDRQTAP